MITIVGGTYYEHCNFPLWEQLYGSGFRAVNALSGFTSRIAFHTYASRREKEHLKAKSDSLGFKLFVYDKKEPISFYYLHSLSAPYIHPSLPYERLEETIYVEGENVLRYGMLEGDVVVKAKKAVYDPQSQNITLDYFQNGSTANELVVVLNRKEANNLYGYNSENDITILQSKIKQEKRIKAIIIKRGSKGALLITSSNSIAIPAYKTNNVWKIGSGDVFSSTFIYYWAEKKFSLSEAAKMASISTAYYCDTKAVPIKKYLDLKKKYKPLSLNFRKNDKNKKTYLAGPFFNMSQLWMINEARNNLNSEQLNVLSPRHDIGIGVPTTVAPKDIAAIKSSKLLFAVLDGLDTGTLFEIGYARALDIPVVIYLHNEKMENLTMLIGSDCKIYNDFCTAIYHAIWEIYKK